jgi:hypothetical protein
VGSTVQDATIAGATRGSKAYENLRQEVVAAVERGRPDPLRRWLDRELDSDGAPRRLPVREWPFALALLAEARRGLGGNWLPYLDARIEGFFLNLLRFMRPDGSMVFGPSGISDSIKQALGSWADHLSDPGFNTVLNWWFPGPKKEHSPPPLPASARADHPLAILRADWLKTGDLVAIDHRQPGPMTSFELAALGRTWLGPTWSCGTDQTPVGRARARLWVSNASVDLAEWSFHAGDLKVVRTALLFRGRRLALLADQIEGKPTAGELRIATPEGIDVIPSVEDRSLGLTVGSRLVSPRLIPLGLPYRSTGEERGTFRREGNQNELVLRQPFAGKRGWLPLLISWESGRNRKTLVWRPLTVSQGSKICGAETAVAYRVAWGRDESLVIYRSLARPVPRSFLGHKTIVRFLVGLFTKEGNVEPILTVET